MIYPHTLNLYQKPALGTSLIRRLPTYNYKHSINAIGGFDTMECDVAVPSIDEGQQFLDQFIGNMVRVFVDNPVEAAWEGYINRMTFNAGSTQYTISLDDMANRLRTTYTSNVGAITTPAAVNDTNSQAIYGIKEDRIELKTQNVGTTMLTNILNTMLAQRAWPQKSRMSANGLGGGVVHIECLGFFHTLEWETYQDATVADQALNTFLGTLLAAVANGTTFFDNTVLIGIAANAITIQRTSIRGETIWDRMKVVREVGDGANYYVLGVTPTNFITGTRTLYYRVFNSTIVYTARQSDGLIIRNPYGQKVDPWRVQPDNGVRIQDELIGWNGLGDNPTETWMMAVDYDANAQLATWRGDDDQTAEGVFNWRKQNKVFGKHFGAQYRSS